MRADRNAVHLLVRQHCETKRKYRSNIAELACATIGAEQNAVVRPHRDGQMRYASAAHASWLALFSMRSSPLAPPPFRLSRRECCHPTSALHPAADFSRKRR
jgi:hypothetical protein